MKLFSKSMTLNPLSIMIFNDSYAGGSTYEIFIRRAHKSYQGTTGNGGEGVYMKNLIDTENGKDLERLVGSYEKQFAKVSGYISKAIDKYLKMKVNAEEKADLENLKQKLSRSGSAYDLVRITDEGLEITKRFKDY
jgi:hypothetical protein